MREINTRQIIEVVKKLCIEANLYLEEDVLAAFEKGEKMEESPVGKEVFQQLKENARLAAKKKWLCVRILAWPSFSWSWARTCIS